MYYSMIGIISIVIHFILNNEFFINKEEKNETNKAFKRYLWAALAYYITDALWGVIYDTHIIVLIYADTILYYIAMALTVVLLCRYVTTYLNLKTLFGKAINYFGLIFGIAEITILFINHFVHIFFWIEPDGTYHAYLLRYVALYMQLILCFFLAIQTGFVAKKEDSKMKRRYFTVFLFCVEMTVAIMAQILFPLLPLYSIGLLVGICIIHTFIKLDEKEEQKKLLEKKNEEFAEVNEEQYAQLEEIVALNELLRQNQEEREKQYEVLVSMSDIFYSMHVINLEDDTVVEFNAKNEVKSIVNRKYGAIDMMANVITTVVSKEYLGDALEFTDLTTVADRMKNRKTISSQFVGNNIGWFLAMFITIDSDWEGKPTRVIFSTRVIDEEKKREEKLLKKSNTDELTGLFNRRAYEEDIYEYNDIPKEDDFVYISMDVNGLKVVNDDLGHLAGDELICGACMCMKNSLGTYGKLYRTGGDEFVAILTCSEDKIKSVLEDFDNSLAAWRGKLVDSVSVSYGYTCKAENPSASVRELGAIAEKRMYTAKADHYRRQGVDRRGQQDAHKVLCDLYTKILKINLTEDTYQIINMDVNEQTEEKGFADRISEWLTSFGKSGQVHPDDLDSYLELTDIEYMRDYFHGSKTSLNIFYRRKYEDSFKQVMMEIVPANDYSSDNQSLFLYVKNIDK